MAAREAAAVARATYFCASCQHGHTKEVTDYLRELNSAVVQQQQQQQQDEAGRRAATAVAAGRALYDAGGASGLHLAAGNGHVDIVTAILNSGLLAVDAEELSRPVSREQGAMSRTPPVRTGRTALHWAAVAGHVEVVEVLLKRDAWADAADSISGDTALHLAMRRGDDLGAACVQMLVSSKAGISVKNNSGMSPLDEAIISGNIAMVKFLEQLCPNDVPRLLRTSTPVPGVSLLHVAAALGSEAGVKFLVDRRGVDVNGKDTKKKFTPLMMGCGNFRGYKTVRIAKRLLDAGCDPCWVSDVTAESAWSLASSIIDGVGSDGRHKAALCALLREWGAHTARTPASGATLQRERSALDAFKALDETGRQTQVMKWCLEPSSAPFDADLETWKKVSKDLLNFHYTCADFKLVNALRVDRDFQDDMSKKHTRQAIEEIMANPTAAKQWETHKSAMRAMAKLRMMKTYGIGKGARFPLEYFIVSQMSDDKFRQKQESVTKCRDIALARVLEEAEIILTAAQTTSISTRQNAASVADAGASSGMESDGVFGTANMQSMAGISQILSSVGTQLVQFLAGPLLALLINYFFIRMNAKKSPAPPLDAEPMDTQ